MGKRQVVIGNSFSLNMLPYDFVADVIFIEKLTLDEVKNKLKDGFVSIIGHQDLANVLSNMLGVEIPANRTTFQLTQWDTELIVAQYKGPRLPEGATKLPENAKIEFFSVIY